MQLLLHCISKTSHRFTQAFFKWSLLIILHFICWAFLLCFLIGGHAVYSLIIKQFFRNPWRMASSTPITPTHHPPHPHPTHTHHHHHPPLTHPSSEYCYCKKLAHNLPFTFVCSSKDLTRAKAKQEQYNFDYFVLMCKSYETMKHGKKKKKKNDSKLDQEVQNFFFANAEDEIFQQVRSTKLTQWCWEWMHNSQWEDWLFQLVIECFRTQGFDLQV